MRKILLISLFISILFSITSRQVLAVGYGIVEGQCVFATRFFDTLEECQAKLNSPDNPPNPLGDKTVNCMSTPDGISCDSNPDESIAIVNLTLVEVPVLEKDLDSTNPSEYFYCLKTNPQDCDKDDLRSSTKPVPFLSSVKSTRTDESSQTITFPKLCGDGDNKLKEICKDNGSDWFHAGKTYRVTIFEKQDPESPTIRDAGFYVSHFYPRVIKPTASPKEGDPNLSYNAVKNGTTITVELQGRKNKKTGKDANKFNDYWIRVEGFDNDYKSDSKCLYIPPSGNQIGSATIPLPKDFKDEHGNVISKLTAGKYLIKIKDGKDEKNNSETCEEGDFTYYYIPFVIGQGDKPGKYEKEIEDPFGKEGDFEGARTKPQPVCDDIDMEDGLCTKIPTGLGIKISTQPQFFIRDIFTIVLSIGGIAAIAFFIQAGYTLMTSAGNKEKVGAAREQITAAIMGLIFIILSIAILEFVGINILRIPGFTR